jgi:medium-chain acyl-[acyl-carrier-protein] hydrolase
MTAYDAPGLRLFCLPHAGGSAGAFGTWRRWLPRQVRLTPVELPGHGTRLTEPLIADWQPLLDDLYRVIAGQIDGPFAIFGHSLGALLAFETSRMLLRRAGVSPVLLVAAGRNGPSAPPSYRPIHDLPDSPFLDALRRLGGVPDALLRNAELRQLFLPGVRTDLRLAERYARRPGPPLACPVLAFAGRRDVMTDHAGVLAWTRETTAGCDLVFVDGGHFFLQDDQFTTALGDRLARVAATAGDPVGHRRSVR